MSESIPCNSCGRYYGHNPYCDGLNLSRLDKCELDKREQSFSKTMMTIEKLKSENKKLREALEFYAYTNNWHLNTINPCDQDHVIGGLLARKVLKEVGDG